MMKLMAIMAHPDDAEIWCGGTLIRHAEKKDVVRICILSYTEQSTRGKEAQEGAKRMGCEVELFGLKDTAIRDTDEAADRLRLSLNSFRPDIIIAHWYDDMHPDHEAAFRLLRRSLLRDLLVNPRNDYKDFPRIFCCDTYNSTGLRGPFRPDRFVDVASVWQKKIFAINAHASEPLPIYLAMINRQCLAHGNLSETKRAEGFIHLPMFGIPDNGSSLGG